MTELNHPDPKKHQLISFVKSSIRIVACVGGVFGSIAFLAVGLLLAEIVGVYEELV
tara:strand:+ start:1401 stop:1568 length:168 start_codon:yes stop_codon:yes gene_type:complete